MSSHLHHWIDLVFGYKQQGEEALKADNCESSELHFLLMSIMCLLFPQCSITSHMKERSTQTCKYQITCPDHIYNYVAMYTFPYMPIALQM